MYVSVTNLRVNNANADDTVKIAEPYPSLTWEYTFTDRVTVASYLATDASSPYPAGYEIKIGTSFSELGTDDFSGDIIETGFIASKASSWRYRGLALKRGNVYYGQIKLSDDLNNESDWQTFSFEYNSLPEVFDQTISPAEPTVNDDLVLTYEFYDPDNDTEAGTRIWWYKNGIHQRQFDNQTTIESKYVTHNDSWSAQIFPSDGFETGPVVSSNTVSITKVAPVVDSLKIEPDSPTTNDPLYANYFFAGDKDKSNIRWFKNDVLLDINTRLARFTTVAGDVVRFEVQPSDGDAVGTYIASDNVTIQDKPYRIANVLIDGELEPLSLNSLTPTISWKIAGKDLLPDVISFKIGTVAGAHDVYSLTITDARTSLSVPANLLQFGIDYYITIQVNSDPSAYAHFRTSGSLWQNNVSNATGWTLESTLRVSQEETSSSSSSSSSELGISYQGIRVYDGTKFAEIRFYLDKLVLISESTVSVASDFSGYNVITVTGSNSDIKVYKNSVLLLDGSGVLTKTTTDKSIEIGAIGSSSGVIGDYINFYYTVDGAFSPGTSNYYALKFQDFFESQGEVDFIDGTNEEIYCSISDESDGINSGVYQILDYQVPVTLTPQPVTDSLSIKNIESDIDGRYTSVSHDKGITVLENTVIANYDGNLNFLQSENPTHNGWTEVSTGTSPSFTIDGLKFDTRGIGGKLYYSQNLPGSKWFDDVNNKDGWTIHFSLSVSSVTDDNSASVTGDPDGAGLYISDGKYNETISFYPQEIVLHNAGKSVVYDNTTVKQFVVTGKENVLSVFARSPTDNIFSLLTTVKLSNRSTVEAAAGRPASDELNNIVHSVWHDDGGKYRKIYYSSLDYTDTNTTSKTQWAIPSLIVDQKFGAANPDIAVDSLGNIFVAFESNRNDNSDIGLVVKSRFGWSTPFMISQDIGRSLHPKIVADNSNQVHLVWEDERELVPQVYYSMRSIDGTWSSPVSITTSTLGAVRPSIDVLSDIVCITYTEKASDGTSSIYLKSFDGENWSTSKLVAQGINADFSDVAIVENTIFVAWHDSRDDNFEIFGRRFGLNTLLPLENTAQLTNDQTASRFPSLGISVSETSTRFNVYVAYESGGDLSPYHDIDFTATDTTVNMCYFDWGIQHWLSSNQSTSIASVFYGGYDVTLLPADDRYMRRPALPRRFADNLHLLYESEDSLLLDEYLSINEDFVLIRDAVYDLNYTPVYTIVGSGQDQLVSGQLPRREIRFGDFSETRNFNITFGYLRFYIKDAVDPFSIKFVPLEDAHYSVPNAYGDCWIASNDGLFFYFNNRQQIASTTILSAPTSIHFDSVSRMYVLADDKIYYSTDHYSFTELISGSGIVDFVVDSRDNIWVSTNTHVIGYSQGTSSIMSVSAYPTSLTVRNLTIDGVDTIWAATSAGLVSIKNTIVVIYNATTSSLPTADIRDITVRNGSIRYLATAAGLYQMQGTNFVKVSVNDSRWNEQLNTVEWKSPNILWASSGAVLYQITIDDEHDTTDVVAFSALEFAAESINSSCLDLTKYVLDFDFTDFQEALVQLYVNGRLLRFGYKISGNKIKLDSPLLPEDEFTALIRRDVNRFSSLEQNKAELLADGQIFRRFSKLITDGTRLYGAIDGDKKQLAIFNQSVESELPYDRITLDSTPPTGSLVFEKITSNKRIIQMAIQDAADNLSGLSEMIVSNHPNLTTDGETPQEWVPYQERFLHNLGTDLGNVFTQLSFTSAIGNCLGKFGTDYYAGTSSPATVYKYNSTDLTWSLVSSFTDENDDTSIDFLIEYKNALFVGTSSPSGSAKLWSSADGSAFSIVSTFSNQYAKCATILNGNMFVGTGGTNGGKLYLYNGTNFENLFSGTLGNNIHSLSSGNDALYVATSGQGYLYKVTADAGVSIGNSTQFKAQIAYIDSDTTIKSVLAAYVPSDTTLADGTTLDQFVVFAGTGTTGKIVKSIDSNPFGISFSTIALPVAKLAIDQDSVVHSTVGSTIYKYSARTWKPVITNSSEVKDVLFDSDGLWLIDESGIKRMLYEVSNKKVYLALRDVAGNSTQEPGSEPSTDSSSIIPFVEIAIDDIQGFVNENRILELDEYGVEVFNYDGESSFYSANKVEVERAEYYSEIFNGSTDHVSWDIIYWDAIVPDDTDLTIYLRSSTSRSAILSSPFVKTFTKDQFQGADISSLSGQYIQFKVVMSTLVRGKSPKLYAVNLRGRTRASVHFFTTNFTLPSRMRKGLITANSFIPVAAEVIYGINTNDSTDFSDYQIIEPDRFFEVDGNQSGKNLRIGVKLISPLSVTARTDAIVEYDGIQTLYNNVIDFSVTNSTVAKTQSYKIEMYEDADLSELAATLFTGTDPQAWSVDNEQITSSGVNLLPGETVNVLAAVKGNAAIRCNQYYYPKIYSSDNGTVFTVLSDDSLFIAGCNPTFASTIEFDFQNNSASTHSYHFRVKFYSDAIRTQLVKTYFSGQSQSGWLNGIIALGSTGVSLTSGQTKSVSFTPPDGDLESGTYYIVVDYYLNGSFVNFSNSYSIIVKESFGYSCGEYDEVPIVKDLAFTFELEDFTEQFGSRERTKRSIQINLR